MASVKAMKDAVARINEMKTLAKALYEEVYERAGFHGVEDSKESYVWWLDRAREVIEHGKR